MLSGLEGVTVTNALQISGGADVEADDPYKERLLLEFSSTRGGGTQDDYVATALARPGIGSVVVEPRWDGPGTVRLILADPSGNSLSTQAVDAEQEFWDPAEAPGDGLGAAPINHLVTVDTVTTVAPPVELWLQLEAGYTITGEAGKADVSTAIIGAVSDYIASLHAGEDELLHRIMQAALQVPGVYDVPQVTINAVNDNFTVSALQVARPGTITLTTDAP